MDPWSLKGQFNYSNKVYTTGWFRIYLVQVWTETGYRLADLHKFDVTFSCLSIYVEFFTRENWIRIIRPRMGSNGIVYAWTFVACCIICLGGGISENLCNAGQLDMSVISEIKTWWKEMSIQKPLSKCKLPKKWIIDSPILNLFSDRVIVSSFPCGPGELNFLSHESLWTHCSSFFSH